MRVPCLFKMSVFIARATVYTVKVHDRLLLGTPLLGLIFLIRRLVPQDDGLPVRPLLLPFLLVVLLLPIYLGFDH